ncbi:MAG: hypothetical protein AAGJ18_18935, partial [Bacteroidota bacterium]
MKNSIIGLLVAFLGMFPLPVEDLPTTTINEEETLIVFAQSTDIHFKENTLPELRKFATKKGIALVEKEVADGVPAMITVTPAIVFQNGLGRSIYAARYATFSTIENFIRTSRFFPQQATVNEKKQVLLWKKGRTKVVAPVKVTPLTGKVPATVDPQKFAATLEQALTATANTFSLTDKVHLQRTDRAFYLDVHPYVDKQQQLHLTLEVFSQFSCIDPIFSNRQSPLVGALAQKEVLIKQAMVEMEGFVKKHIETAKNGDSFSVLSSNLPAVTWADLGLALPQQKEQQFSDVATNYTLPKAWSVAGPISENVPLVQFRFMAPLDRYLGEVTELSGNLTVGSSDALENGYFEVNTQSLTMGVPDFDAKIHKSYIKAFKFPKAYFRFANLTDLPSLIVGQATEMEVAGFFKMMKKEIPLTVNATLLPIVDKDGLPQLRANVQFSLNITDTFGVKGP